MSKKPTLILISSGYMSTTQINANLEALRDSFDNTLSLDGSTPNAMQADLDMDSNDISNVKNIGAQTITVNGIVLTPTTDFTGLYRVYDDPNELFTTTEVLTEGLFALAGGKMFKVGAAGETVGTANNFYDLSRRTATAAAYHSVGQANGSVFVLDGEMYEKDSTLTGDASCTTDLSVDGLKPHGVHFAAHYGITQDKSAADELRKANMRTQARAQDVRYQRKLSLARGGTLSLEDVGAVEGSGQLDCSPFISQALLDVQGADTGGTLLIPAGRWFCDTEVDLVRGTNTASMRMQGEGESSILDFRSNVNTNCLGYDGTGTDGPTYMQFDGFTLRGDTAQTKIGINADYLSSSILNNMVFEKLGSAIYTEESYALGIYNSRFNNLTDRLIRFNTNAHSFRFQGNRCNDVGVSGVGDVFTFNTDPSDAESHSIYIAGNNFDGVATLVRTSASSGGLTGLTWLGNYSEGFLNGSPFFDFSNDGVRGFTCKNGSFSVASGSSPDTQVIDYVEGGEFRGNRINGMTFEQGANTKFFDWGKNTVIGGGGAVPQGWITGVAHDATAGTNEFNLGSTFDPQASFTAPRYRSTENGEVVMEGHIDIGSTLVGTPTAFTLPTGLRPEVNQEYITASSTGQAILRVGNNGAVSIRSADGTKVGLNGIKFKVA